jgi:hypothetical protein
MLGPLSRAWGVLTVLLALVFSVVRFEVIAEDGLGPLLVDVDADGLGGDELAAPAELAAVDTIRYGGLDIALLDIRPIPDNNSGSPIIVIDLVVGNDAQSTVRLPEGYLHLISETERVVPLSRFEFADFRDRLVLEPGDTQRALAVFKLGPAASADPADYDLSIGESGRWPVIVPLVGDAPPSTLPRPLSVSEAAAANNDDGATWGRHRLTVIDAVTTLDHGAFRAATGDHLAVVTVKVARDPAADSDAATATSTPAGPAPGSPVDGGPASSSQEPSDLLDRDRWVLTQGRLVHRAIRVDPVASVEQPGVSDLQLVFTYPSDAVSLELGVTPADGSEPLTVARFWPETDR